MDSDKKRIERLLKANIAFSFEIDVLRGHIEYLKKQLDEIKSSPPVPSLKPSPQPTDIILPTGNQKISPQ
jgi:hypothetical protein